MEKTVHKAAYSRRCFNPSSQDPNPISGIYIYLNSGGAHDSILSTLSKPAPDA